METIDYYGYTLTPLYRSIDEALAEEIMAMWQRNGVIDDVAERRRRVAEVAMGVRAPGGELVGVSTVYPGRIGQRGPFYFYRMYIEPGHRRTRMMLRVALATRELLRNLEGELRLPGMVIVTENPKLMRRGAQRLFQRNGCRHLGRTPQRQDVWLTAFE